jgi:hypothetical protein
MPTLIGQSTTVAQGTVYGPIQATFNKSYASGLYKLYVVSGAVARTQTSLSPYLFWSTVTVGGAQVGVQAVLSGYSFTARCGGAAKLALSGYSSSITGTTEVHGSVVGTLPLPTLTASATVDLGARAYLTTVTKYSLAAYGGGRAVGELSGYALTAGGLTDKVGKAVLKAPRPTLVATGTTDNVATVIGTLPALRAAPSAVVIKKLPRATLVAVGTTGAPAAYEAYSLTFFDTRDGVDVAGTHYTDFPFDRIVRFNNKYYGMKADGLFELSGDTFDGAPIIAVVKTADTDFDTDMLKRPISLYFAGEIRADFRMTVTTAEIQDDQYTYRTADKTGARNYRVMFGKGVRARYIGYAFTNTNGGDFVLDDIAPEIAVLRRTA